MQTTHKLRRRLKWHSIHWKQDNTAVPGVTQNPERNAGNKEERDSGSKLTLFIPKGEISLQRISFVNGIEFQNPYRSVKLRFTYVRCPSLREYLSRLQRMLDYIDIVSLCALLLSGQAYRSRANHAQGNS